MVSSKIGRPKVDMPKNVDLKVRVDQPTHKRLVDYTKKHGITIAEAFRKGINMLLGSEKERG